jgi:3-oxoadipate enol-lactonase
MDRPPLVLLHPFPLDSRSWGPMLAALGDDGGWRAAPDFPGLGTAAPEERPSIDGAADAVAAIVREEAPGGRGVLCGLSMGGYVALSVAARHPEVVRGLVLVSTRAEPDSEQGRADRDALARTVREEGLSAFLDAFLPRLHAEDAPAEARRASRAIAEEQDPEAVARALEALRDRGDRRPDLGRMDVPALVVSGEADGVTTPEVMRALAGALPDAELRTLPRLGHLCALEAPAAIAAEIDAFLRRRVLA